MWLFVFYLSHRLVRVREIESHMGKHNGNPDLVCAKESTQYLQSMKGGILGKSMMELRQILLIQASVRQRESFFPITCYVGNLVVIGKTKIRNSNFPLNVLKVSKVAKIKNRYNQVPHLTQDTNRKVTNSQKTPQTRAKRSALSQQVTTKHI